MATLVAQICRLPEQLIWPVYDAAKQTPAHILLLILTFLSVVGIGAIYILLHLLAPKPRAPYPSEKTYLTTNPDGSISAPRQLPCWYDRWLAEGHLLNNPSSLSSYPSIPAGFPVPDQTGAIEPAEVEMSVVIPAYNEADRIVPALEEMVEYLDQRFGRPNGSHLQAPRKKGGSSRPTTPHRTVFKTQPRPAPSGAEKAVGGYEIIIVNDGSKDRTVDVALEFSKKHGLHDILRVVTLEKNRGKGGGVTHGLRHVRGEYAVFADADGASKFSDLGKLIEGCEDVVDGSNRGVAIGSRAHLVGSEEVVKRSAIRNFLMRSFHFVLMILTPPATSRIRDTQCGFKLFSRAALPHIVPYMHSEGWIFDIEMLMLAESAPATPVLASDGSVIGTSYGIKVAEVPIGWHEVGGSKMSLMQDSIKMAIGLAVLRASWMFGVYRRRLPPI
ncbi:dolichyl-phosphate beta-glucosyltransferase [Diplogelasinospora grovesii]|uniref:dolichyl-phosphate beta-glucosyltransferase n=1 Tax=Diplogelasinospora grovesii TaxID=303347 RepID=A0AAN6NHK6_9PEZI|nr:dolichyl-phosphate beta-glucosyltransferase [Diplogelasinospora grovesii]